MTDEIVPPVPYEAADPPLRRFMPWHRPRKQLVRRFQWMEQTRRLLNEHELDGPVKYLGLPGADLLDVRALREIITPHREFAFLGFMSGGGDARIHLNISLQEVKALDGVLARSRVVEDDITSLSSVNSMGMKAAREVGPFDVINLDLCDNLLTSEIGERSIYQAIANIFGLQNRRPDPWLLFITTRAERATVHADVSAKLDGLLADNVNGCETFAEALEELSAGLREKASLTACEPAQWLDVFCIALSKTILASAIKERMALEVKSTMSYRVAPSAPDSTPSDEPDDLVSIAYLLTPSLTPGGDSGGLAAPQPGPDECSLASRLPKRISGCVKVDEEVARDAALLQRLTDETAALLVEARYPEEGYRAWAAGYAT